MLEHPDAAMIRSGYEASNRSDAAGFFAILAHDIIWHEQTCRTLRSDHVGVDAVGAFLDGLQGRGLTTMRLEPYDILASDSHVVALLDVRMERGELTTESREVHVWHLRDGQAAEVWLISHDPDASDAFWNAALGTHGGQGSAA